MRPALFCLGITILIIDSAFTAVLCILLNNPILWGIFVAKVPFAIVTSLMSSHLREEIYRNEIKNMKI